MTSRTITAIYDSEADANIARDQLLNNGLDDDDVRVVGQNLQSTSMSTDAGSGDDKGMWESIKDFFVGDDDRPVFSEGLRRGGYLLTARVEDGLSDQAIAVLEQTNAVDLDQRTEQWRTEGWSEDTYVSGERSSFTDTGLTDTDARRDMRGNERTSDEQSIPVVEERLRVGKREVDRGGVRVRSYVVEEPVHEQVSLREERVEVERRPVSGRTAARAGDFEEQTIEFNERGEEAVIAKDSVVTEEVVIRQTAEDRVEEVDETVRRTQVDVEDTRTRGKGAKPSSSRNRG